MTRWCGLMVGAGLVLAGCWSDTTGAATKFPTVAALYDNGIYRTCSPNGGVCHNAHEYPDFSSLGALVEAIGRPCNQLRQDPREIDDLCEREGDWLVAGAVRRRIGHVEGADAMWSLFVDAPLPGELADVAIVRREDGRDYPLLALSAHHAQLALDPRDARTLAVTLAPDEAPMAVALRDAGIPARADVVQLWDPNANGRYGVELDGALIRAGAPDKSYVIHRLTDPHAGTLMPLANVCAWTPASLRALWCWIAGLRQDRSNAYDPIDYGACPDGPDMSRSHFAGRSCSALP